MSDKALPNYKWIKFPIASLDDRDFMGLQNASAGAYLKLYLLAARSDSGGLLCNGRKVFNKEDLAWYLRSDVKSIEPYLDELTRTGLVKFEQAGYWITHFMEEQGPGDNQQREKWIERQRKCRARVLKSESEENQNKEEEREEEEADLEGEKESHGDVTVTAALPPESDFGDYTSERERLVMGYCNLLHFSPSTTAEFIKEHMPAATFESRLENDYSRKDEYTSSMAGQVARMILDQRKEIFSENFKNLLQTYWTTFQESPDEQDTKYLEDNSKSIQSIGVFKLPLALSKTKCQEICSVLEES